MNYLTWIKNEYQTRWAEVARHAPVDRPFLNLAASGMVGAGEAILAHDTERPDTTVDMVWGHLPLRRRLAELYALPSPENVLPVAGGSQGLFLAITALARSIGRDSVVLVDSPTYGPLFEIPRFFGLRVESILREPAATYSLPASPAIPANTALAILSNPNNPTGAFATPTEIAAFFRAMPPEALLLVDESFLSPTDAASSSAATLGDPRIVVVGGLTKPLGLGVLRCGWVLAHKDLIPALRETWTQGFNIGTPLTESPAVRVLDDLNRHHPPLNDLRRRNLDVLTEHLAPLRSAGLLAWQPPPPRAAITFPRIVPLADASDPPGAAKAFYHRLLDRHGVATVPGDWFDPTRAATYSASFRLSFGLPTDDLSAALVRFTSAVRAL